VNSDKIQEAILMCAQKLAEASLIYHMEAKKTEKVEI